VAPGHRHGLGPAPLAAPAAGHAGKAVAARAHLDSERLEHLADDGLGNESASMAFHDVHRIALDSIVPTIKLGRRHSNRDLDRVAITFDGGAPAGDRP
jgi:hypothetical protein